MAKHNLFLGTATRSVGDVTLMRRNGVQVSRVRVRKIANPRTEGQARQRMQFAAVTRFYAPLSACLERSWQGKNRTDSYSAFLKENLKRSKALQFAVPRSAGFIPLPVQLSNGTLPNAQYAYNSERDAGFVLSANTLGDITIGAISRGIGSFYGLNDGDQVTFIWSLAQPDGSYDVHYSRWFLDTSNNTETLEIPGLQLSVFDGENFYGLNINDVDDRIAAFAVVFSRYENNTWRRSTQVLSVRDGLERDYIGAAAQAVYLSEWMASDTVPTSDVYLNGNPASPTDLNLTAWVVGTGGSGAVGEAFSVIGAHVGDWQGERVWFLDGSAGQSMPLMGNNSLFSSFGRCLLGVGSGYMTPEDPVASDYCTFQNDAAKNENGSLGKDAILFLQSHGISPQNSLFMGGFER